MADTLRTELIKLAHSRPELRADLMPLIGLGKTAGVEAAGCPTNLDESECKEWEANTEKYKDVVKDKHTAGNKTAGAADYTAPRLDYMTFADQYMRPWLMTVCRAAARACGADDEPDVVYGIMSLGDGVSFYNSGVESRVYDGCHYLIFEHGLGGVIFHLIAGDRQQLLDVCQPLLVLLVFRLAKLLLIAGFAEHQAENLLDRPGDENDPLLEQPGIDVVGPLPAVGLLDHHGDEVLHVSVLWVAHGVPCQKCSRAWARRARAPARSVWLSRP